MRSSNSTAPILPKAHVKFESVAVKRMLGTARRQRRITSQWWNVPIHLLFKQYIIPRLPVNGAEYGDVVEVPKYVRCTHDFATELLFMRGTERCEAHENWIAHFGMFFNVREYRRIRGGNDDFNSAQTCLFWTFHSVSVILTNA